MKKRRYSLSLDSETIEMIEEAARINGSSRSAIARMVLQTIRYLPFNRLRETSPVPAILGIDTKEVIHESD